MTDVFELRLQGIVLRFDEDWHLTATVLHGAYLTHRVAGFSMHVRGWWPGSGDTAWLLREVHAQNWVGPPSAVVERVVEGRNIVGGTFGYGDAGKLVREWFISDGRHGANASLLFPEDTPRSKLEPYERMIDSIVFAEI